MLGGVDAADSEGITKKQSSCQMKEGNLERVRSVKDDVDFASLTLRVLQQ